MSNYIVSLNQVNKVIQEKKEILKNVCLSFFYGAKIGVLGINGAGKSTLLRILARLDKDYVGDIYFKPGIKIGYLSQEPILDPVLTVRQTLEEAVQEIKTLLESFDKINARFAEPLTPEEMDALLEEQGTIQSAIDAVNGWELDRQLEIAAEALRLPPWESVIANLSGGEKRRVALCQLLLKQPDLLLLDEPTNHLDAESVDWLEHFLQKYKGTLVTVTHDRYFLDNVAGWILEIDRGQAIPYEGNYSAWLEQKEKRLAAEKNQERAIMKLIEQEKEWIQKSPKGRQAKSKARITQFEELNSMEFQKSQETQALYIPPGPRLGNLVIEAANISKSIGSRILFSNLSFQLPPGGILGIIGPNGAGKSTFLKVITGQEKLDTGSLKIGETVQLSYVDQSRENLNPEKTLWEEISDGLDYIKVGNFQMPSRAYVGRFNFKGPDQQKLVKDLSGGERNRVHLAKLLRSGGNVLLLDEPTNDLDVATLQALEEAILSFPGCVLIVSHDRWFLDRVATHILAFEGNSQVKWFVGNYSAYAADYAMRMGNQLRPHRLKYKKLME